MGMLFLFQNRHLKTKHCRGPTCFFAMSDRKSSQHVYVGASMLNFTYCHLRCAKACCEYTCVDCIDAIRKVDHCVLQALFNSDRNRNPFCVSLRLGAYTISRCLYTYVAPQVDKMLGVERSGGERRRGTVNGMHLAGWRESAYPYWWFGRRVCVVVRATGLSIDWNKSSRTTPHPRAL